MRVHIRVFPNQFIEKYYVGNRGLVACADRFFLIGLNKAAFKCRNCPTTLFDPILMAESSHPVTSCSLCGNKGVKTVFCAKCRKFGICRPCIEKQPTLPYPPLPMY